MKTSLIILTLSLSMMAGASVPAKKKVVSAKAAAPSAAAVAASKKNSRDIRFNGSNVDGKYLSAGESIAEVEGDKEMGALIGIRKNFRDRLGDETARLQSASAGKGN